MITDSAADFVCQIFGRRTIKKLVGNVSWYLGCHAATLRKDSAQYLPRMHHVGGNSGQRGGRVSYSRLSNGLKLHGPVFGVCSKLNMP
jgi:hypothetical protein